MSSDQKTIEEHVIDALYTAVGVGVIAYKLTEQRRKRFRKTCEPLVRELLEVRSTSANAGSTQTR